VLRFSGIFGDFGDGPLQGGAEGFVDNGAAGLADGRQPLEGPFRRAAVAELSHQETVDHQHQVHMPCLALAAAELAISHAQFLFAVTVKGFRACPALPVGVQDACDFPTRAIGHQDLGHGLITTIAPQEDDPHGMLHLRQADDGGVVPLSLVAATQFPTLFAGNRRGPLVRSDRPARRIYRGCG